MAQTNRVNERSFGPFVVFAILLSCNVRADNWPQWRGPDGNGISREKALPTRWSNDENVLWKTPLRGLGTSSPVVWRDHVFLTFQIGQGPFEQGGSDFQNSRVSTKTGNKGDKVYFVVQALRRSNGRLLWEYQLEADGELTPVHRKHNLASPSCVTDGDRIYAWFGTGQLVALDLEGKLLWKRHLGKEYSPFEIRWGHGSSPVLYKDYLILLCDHLPASYLLALDKHTGEERWKVDRGSRLRSYATPLIITAEKGDELIINSNRRLDAYDPSSGELLWHAGKPNKVPVPMPVYHDGVLYASRGYSSGPYMAIRTGGRGDVSKTHILWRVATGAPYVSSLLYYRGLVYMANERGIVTCVDAKTGEMIWRQRMGGVFTASPVAADGKIYLLNEGGETVVLQAGHAPRVLERNSLNERSLASLAISNSQLFIRTDEHLICIGGR